MTEAPETHPSLLVRLRDPRDEEAWTQFVHLYAPLVYSYARGQGLQDADAADLTQNVLRAVVHAVGDLDYDPARGSFRGWLFTVVRNKLRNFLTRRPEFCQGTGDSAIQEQLNAQPAPADPVVWEEKWEQRLFTWAAQQVRRQVSESTLQAFWQTAVQGKPGKAVARELGLSVAAVYLAKSRVMARLVETIKRIQDTETIEMKEP